MDNLSRLHRKIISAENLSFKLAKWQFKGYKTVFTNGCFDILHPGHIDYLSKAADHGDILIVAINTDASVKKLKGENRPILNEDARSLLIASLRFVDYVILFDDETPYELINEIKPNVLIKGSDYAIEEIVGHDIVLKNGGEVKTIQLTEEYSTTMIENKIKGIE
ncbi:MAG: D-glycero-beta-D-manno-heptose 1-phosphate adenylyltransferase [Bacteroidetes bacterium]|nr:D-glycero-beta-D-manno-heptose 1-phosphate adenylyltransferase [Bacteroidota bacterium]|tara:strand:+ start:115 stop:609 length:495 start_codon:yes stop_codon:yes gene_type:complete